MSLSSPENLWCSLSFLHVGSHTRTTPAHTPPAYVLHVCNLPATVKLETITTSIITKCERPPFERPSTHSPGLTQSGENELDKPVYTSQQIKKTNVIKTRISCFDLYHVAEHQLWFANSNHVLANFHHYFSGVLLCIEQMLCSQTLSTASLSVFSRCISSITITHCIY